MKKLKWAIHQPVFLAAWGDKYGDFIVHGTVGKTTMTITHAPTGYCCAQTGDLEKAREMAEAFQAVKGWDKIKKGDDGLVPEGGVPASLIKKARAARERVLGS